MRVLYPGGYDLIHQGHSNALNAAARVALPFGKLIVGVNTDRLMTHYKRSPRRMLEQRIRDVQRLGIADEVIPWDGPDGQAQRILTINPDIYIAGTDWLTKDLAQQLSIPFATGCDGSGGHQAYGLVAGGFTSGYYWCPCFADG